jgi:hypothetical protein
MENYTNLLQFTKRPKNPDVISKYLADMRRYELIAESDYPKQCMACGAPYKPERRQCYCIDDCDKEIVFVINCNCIRKPNISDYKYWETKSNN